MTHAANSIPWFNLLRCALLGAATGAYCGAHIAVEYNRWYSIASSDGAAFYFVSSIGLRGLVAGLLLGLITAYFLPGGAGRQLLFTFGVIVLFSWGTSEVLGAEAPPTIAGEELNLLLELRSPDGWRASNLIRNGNNRLTVTMPAARVMPNPFRGVDIDWQLARTDAGYTVVPGSVPLNGSSAPRRVTVDLGKQKISLVVPMPARPTAEQQHWSEWLPVSEESDAALKGFRYRFRVERNADTVARVSGETNAREQAIRRRLAALGSKAPVTAYLDLYCNDLYREYEIKFSDETNKSLYGRADELAPLLASPKYSRYAIMATMQMPDPLPKSFEGPLRKVPMILMEAIRAYRAGNPDDPDVAFGNAIYFQFESWVTLWKRLERPLPPELRQVGEAAAGLPNVSFVADIPRRVEELLAEGKQ